LGSNGHAWRAFVLCLGLAGAVWSLGALSLAAAVSWLPIALADRISPSMGLVAAATGVPAVLAAAALRRSWLRARYVLGIALFSYAAIVTYVASRTRYPRMLSSWTGESFIAADPWLMLRPVVAVVSACADEERAFHQTPSPIHQMMEACYEHSERCPLGAHPEMRDHEWQPVQRALARCEPALRPDGDTQGDLCSVSRVEGALASLAMCGRMPDVNDEIRRWAAKPAPARIRALATRFWLRRDGDASKTLAGLAEEAFSQSVVPEDEALIGHVLFAYLESQQRPAPKKAIVSWLRRRGPAAPLAPLAVRVLFEPEGIVSGSDRYQYDAGDVAMPWLAELSAKTRVSDLSDLGAWNVAVVKAILGEYADPRPSLGPRGGPDVPRFERVPVRRSGTAEGWLRAALYAPETRLLACDVFVQEWWDEGSRSLIEFRSFLEREIFPVLAGDTNGLAPGGITCDGSNIRPCQNIEEIADRLDRDYEATSSKERRDALTHAYRKLVDWILTNPERCWQTACGQPQAGDRD
jgi:hypothetical protein